MLVQDAKWPSLGEPAGVAGVDTTASMRPPAAREVSPLPALAAPLPLSEEQRSLVHAGVMRVANAPVAEPIPPRTAALPTWVALHDLPAGVVGEIPLLRGYKFVKLDDRILLVSPANRAVVGEIPRYRLLP